MNIYFVKPQPDKAAKWVYNNDPDGVRFRKVCILEAGQILSTAIHLNTKHVHAQLNVYKPTHGRHPMVLWASESRSNYRWLLQHLKASLDLHAKPHKTGDKFRAWELGAVFVPEKGLTRFPNCAKNDKKGLDYTNISLWKAYRTYLKEQWK